MLVRKAGTILLNLQSKKVGLVYRNNQYSFPKGHLENNETLLNCAIRETEEETLRKNHLLINKEIYVLKYTTPSNENVECHYYLSIDDGPTQKNIALKDREIFKWADYNDLENLLYYDNLKIFWGKIKNPIKDIFESNGKITPSILTDLGICPTCYDRNNNHCIFGDNSENMLFENEDFECFLCTNPRSSGHTIISSKKHFKDMLEIPNSLCSEIFVFAKKVMNAIKEVYGSESVYLCTMCDGSMNHFHIQLIPRYAFEKRGSKNFVKSRKDYIEDKDKINKMRYLLK